MVKAAGWSAGVECEPVDMDDAAACSGPILASLNLQGEQGREVVETGAVRGSRSAAASYFPVKFPAP
jgi:hypothetical protein